MIKGWIRTTLLDYPGEIATAIFVGGCCFRCPMCHNPDLVLNPDVLPDISWETVLEYLNFRKGIISGLVISGGEPCLWPDLFPFLRQVRPLGIRIKLDTCGYLPDTLAELLNNKLTDRIAMDIKAPPAKYSQLTGIPNIDLRKINKSIEILRKSGIPYEFRTTVVSGLITKEDIASISDWIHGAESFVLQQFRPQNCLDQELNQRCPYPKEVLVEMQLIARQKIKSVSLRGL